MLGGTDTPLQMDVDPTWLLLSLIPGAAGFVLLSYGRKAGRWPHALAGLLYLAYPYFTNSLFALVGVGVAIGVALAYAVQQGW
jgi:hypothetical protein